MRLRRNSRPGTDEAPASATEAEQATPSPQKDIVRYAYGTVLALCGLLLVVFFPVVVGFIVLSAILLGVCVLVHEWGHLVVARRAGLQINEFSIGFGKRLASRERRGIRYSLKALPLGGSVEIAGMTAEAAEEQQVPREKAYIYSRFWTRLRVALAGVGMNFLLAWGSFTLTVPIVAPERSGWSNLITSPLAGLFAIGTFVQALLHGIGTVFVSLDADVGSVLSLPTSMHEGAVHAASTGFPLGAYFLLVFGLVNLSLAIGNMLPLYPLDGYHTTVTFVDGVRKQAAKFTGRGWAPLTQSQLSTYARVSGGLLAGFVILLVGKDIIRMMF